MSTLCTPEIDVDKEFSFVGEVVKTTIDEATGKRFLTGVASGVTEDRDGERVSRNAIAKMARRVSGGGVKLTSSHQQDWATEIGDAIEAIHDPASDELVIKCELPPEGEDALADKAWRTANREKVGFSIGGKLLKAFYERNELGKRRKVLDDIGLRHFALTKNPSYSPSFAEAVAKSWNPDTVPDDDEFTLELEDVEKAGSDGGEGNVGRDSVGSGPRNAGSRKPSTGGMKTEEAASDDDSDTDADNGEDLPKAKDERHLACPNCGHEFAADLPVDPDERQIDETPDDKDNAETGKSVETPAMSKLTETLDGLRSLAEVNKTTDDAPKDTPAEDVTKTETVTDIEKMVAASHKANTDRLDSIEQRTGEGFELIAKALKDVQTAVADLPRGRQSVARILPPPSGHDDTVEKTVEQLVEEAPDAVSALKILNAAARGGD